MTDERKAEHPRHKVVRKIAILVGAHARSEANITLNNDYDSSNRDQEVLTISKEFEKAQEPGLHILNEGFAEQS